MAGCNWCWRYAWLSLWNFFDLGVGKPFDLDCSEAKMHPGPCRGGHLLWYEDYLVEYEYFYSRKHLQIFNAAMVVFDVYLNTQYSPTIVGP